MSILPSFTSCFNFCIYPSLSRYTLVCDLLISNHLSPSYLNSSCGNTSTLIKTSPLFASIGKLVPKCALAAFASSESATATVLGVVTLNPFFLYLFEKCLEHHQHLHLQLNHLQIHLSQLADIFLPFS